MQSVMVQLPPFPDCDSASDKCLIISEGTVADYRMTTRICTNTCSANTIVIGIFIAGDITIGNKGCTPIATSYSTS